MWKSLWHSLAGGVNCRQARYRTLSHPCRRVKDTLSRPSRCPRATDLRPDASPVGPFRTAEVNVAGVALATRPMTRAPWYVVEPLKSTKGDAGMCVPPWTREYVRVVCAEALPASVSSIRSKRAGSPFFIENITSEYLS